MGGVIQLVLLILSVVVVSALSKENPVVESPAGKFRGHVLKTRDSRDILAFQGIPYAKPPVGKLRFKDPVKIDKLEGVYDATDGTKECFQPTLNLAQICNVSSYTGSEDCLYLNVYKPDVEEGKEALPVLVWIHGGGFYLGSGSVSWNGPEFFLDRDIILVAINYRLGVFGFLTGDNAALPGNYGMKDQVMALKWVQENIASFGGDPNQVTLGGVSAGSMSATLHMHSPLSKGLFHRVIAQSGTLYSPLMYRPSRLFRKDTFQLASDLGCCFEPDKVVRCLQKMPWDEVVNASVPLLPGCSGFYSINLGPVFEHSNPGAFLTEESYNEPSSIPMLMGVNSQESMWLLQEMSGIIPAYSDIENLRADLSKHLPIIGYYTDHPNKEEITRRLEEFYFKDGLKAATPSQIINFDSDIKFNYGHHLVAKREKGPIYMYQMGYRGEPVVPISPVEGLEDGVAHGEECVYLFNMKAMFLRENWSQQDTEMSRKLVQLWYNFIKHGNPTPDTKLWEESGHGVKYMYIGNEGLAMKENMHQDRMMFLDQLDKDKSLTMKHDEL